MDVKPIKTKKDYEATLKAIESLMGAKRGSPEGDRLDVLVTRVKLHRGLGIPAESLIRQTA
jgi:HTH-type transcriptional regulator/antitoxin HigA